MEIKAFSRKQLQILAFPNSQYDALICDGSVRSGKTSVMSVAFVLWAMRDFDRCNFGICSKTVQTAIKNVVKPMLAMTYMQKRFDIKFRIAGAEGAQLEINSGKHKNTFYIYGGKDESSYQLIQGITLAGVLLDEVALMPKSFVEQALARCSVDGRKFWFNCNPEGQLHWFNQEWILQAERHNALRLHFTMEDNPSLSEKIKADYESMYSGVFYDRYIRGLWVAAEGIIYDMFDRNRHVLAKPPELADEYYVSSDFGMQNATTFLLWARIRGTNKWYCAKEWYYSGREKRREKTVSELVDGLQEMLDNIVPLQIIVDPSARALIVEIQRRGLRVLPAINDVMNGIADVSTMLQSDRIFFSDKCVKTIEEFGVYVWDEKAVNRGEDAPMKINDHCMDAVRYFVRSKKLARKTGE